MKQASFKSILFLTLGWFGIQMALALDTTQFQIILDSKVKDAFWIGAVLSLGPVAGIVIQPLVGWYGDRLRQAGISRKKLMLLGSALGVVSTAAIPLTQSLSGLVFWIAMFFAGFNILMVNYRAVVTETSSRKALTHQKGLISGFVALFSGAGSFSMFAICAVLASTVYPFWIGAVLFMVTMFLFFRYAPKPKTNTAIQMETQAVFAPWNILFYAFPVVNLFPALEKRIGKTPAQTAIFRLFLTVFFAWFGIQALRGFFVLYALKSLHITESQANLLLAILTLVMVGSAIPWGKLADRLDNRLLFRYALLFFALVCFGSFFWVQSFFSAVWMSVFLGLSFAGMIVCPLSLLFKLCPAQSEGTYAGLYNLFISVPQLYSLMITGYLIDHFASYTVILSVAAVAVLLGFLTTFKSLSALDPN